VAEPSAPIRHLAVYGTLRSDVPPILAGRPALAGRVRSLGPILLAGTLHDAGDYPVLVHDPAPSATRAVRGELLELLDPGVLAELDTYEELDPRIADAGTGADPDVRVAGDAGAAEYARIVVHVPEHDVPAWLYCAERAVDGLPVIASGDWRTR
jgi:gamma-glutamylcyclotransferase (GGCT)/AIG2-like uncharacterized protein YtfP